MHLTKLLIENGYSVTGIDTNYFDADCEFYPSNYPILKIIKDVRNIEEKDIEGTYAICHLAALSNDPLGELDEQLTFEINHKASVRLAQLAKKCGVEKFIYSSSCSLYGITNGNSALDETAEFNPVTAYAKSKVYSERDIIPLADENYCVTILRNATAYGISPKLRLDLVVNNLIGWAVTTGEIRILSDGTPWRPLIHAEDIARAFISVIETPNEKVNRQAFNTGQYDSNYQVIQLAEMIAAAVPGCKIIITKEHGSDSRSYKVDFNKIKTELSLFKPVWNLEDGIKHIIGSYKKFSLDTEKFNGRYFSRLKQLQYLINSKKLDSDLYWI
jgi:nucleoside-diphosphate-sugar epimerase